MQCFWLSDLFFLSSAFIQINRHYKSLCLLSCNRVFTRLCSYNCVFSRYFLAEKILIKYFFIFVQSCFYEIISIQSYFHEIFLIFSDTKVHHRVLAMRPPCPHTNPAQPCITLFCKPPIFRETNIVNLDRSDTVNPDPIFMETDTVKTDRELFWKPSRFRFCVFYFLSILSEFFSREKLA